MPRIFKHLTRTDRLRIEKCLNEGYTYRQIADVLRVHISTVYREIERGSYTRLNGDTYEFYTAYSPDIAEERYRANLSAKGADLKIETITNLQSISATKSKMKSVPRRRLWQI